MEQYLNDIVSIDDITNDKLNIIESPCGSGKTTFAINTLRKLAGDKSIFPMLYLIDTRNGKDALLAQYHDKIYDAFNGFEIMTYACFAKICKENPDFYLEDCVIVCDELSACVEYSKINPSEDNLHEAALALLYNRFALRENYVVALDATPQLIKDYYSFDKDCINEVPLQGNPKTLKANKVVEFDNINNALNSIDISKRGLIYTDRIDAMKRIIELLSNRGIKANGFWSLKNTDKDMTDEQKKLRKTVLETQSIPDDVQVLVINKSTERGINIYTAVDYIIVDAIDKTVQTQARGRIRLDVDTLYLKSENNDVDIVVPYEFLDVRLYKADKDVLCEILGIRLNGRLAKWTTVRKELEKCGYKVEDKRTMTDRFTVISI